MIKERDHRIAIARIVTDLIEADFVVESSEMDYFERIISKEELNITKAMLMQAKKISLAKALESLSDLDAYQREELLDILKKLSLSDETCVPAEAALIFAIEQVLTNNAKMLSIPYPDINIDNLKTIYIESEESAISKQIEEQQDIVWHELQSVGLDFVYIPSLVGDFKKIGIDYLKKSIRYMIPSSTTDRVNTICDNIIALTTSQFCRDLLHKRLGLDVVGCKPSLLITINDSDIIDKYDLDGSQRMRFSNFLLLEIKEDIIETIHTLTDAYASMINCEVMAKEDLRIPKFIYRGFHRSLFDLIAYGKDTKEYKLVFDFNHHKSQIYFEAINDSSERIALKLNPKESALYYMVVKKSMESEGLDWREHIPSETKDHILEEYNSIYKRIANGKTAKNYKDRVQMHHIKNRISTLRCISNVEAFIPEHLARETKSLYKVTSAAKYIEIWD